MKRSSLETLIGATVVVIALVFFQYSFKAGDVGATGDSYTVHAEFSSVGALRVGDDVSVSGVKIGNVSAIDLNPETFLARVSMAVGQQYKLPTDTAAMISSQSLLGGLYLSLEPGADEEYLEEGGQIQFTQPPQNLEQLLGKFIFNMSENKDQE